MEYTEGMAYEDFRQNSLVQDGVLRNFQVIGDATKKLSGALCARHPLVPWRDMAGLRDRIVHHYFGVDYEVVWHVIRSDLPTLAASMEAVLQEETEGQDI